MKVTLEPAKLTARSLDPLRAVDLTDREIHDAVQVVAYFNYINRVADALGVAAEDFIPRWGLRRG